MSAAIMYGGLGALVQPASATVPPAGTEPNVTYSLSSPVLSFPATPIGSSSSVNETIVANFVTVPSTTLDPAGIVFDSGSAAPDPTDFTVTGGCVNVALNFIGPDSCTETITYTPKPGDSGPFTAVAVFNDTSGDSFNVPITASASAPNLIAVPGAVNFGNVPASGPAATQTVTIKNIGDADATLVGAPSLGPDANFHITGTACNSGITLAPNATCTVDLSFLNAGPITVPTPESNTLTVNPGGGFFAVSVPLSATAVPTPPGPTTISPTSLGLGTVAIGTTVSGTFTVTNNGTVPSSLTGINLSGADFSLNPAGTCSSLPTLPAAPGANSCTIVVDFTPSVAGTESSTVTVTLGGGQPNLTATISGTGVGTTYTITSGPIDFGNVTRGGRSPEMNVVITDVGPAAISLGAPSITGPNAIDFNHSGGTTCAGILNPGQSCTIPVSFTPGGSSAGEETANLSVPIDGGTLSPLNVGLQGNAINPVITITPDFDFGSVPVGSSSADQVFTVTNVSGVNVTLGGTAIAGFSAGQFHKITDGCNGITLTPTETCQISVEFKPTAFGTQDAELIVPITTPTGLPVLIDPLTGVGAPPTTVSISPVGSGGTFDFSPPPYQWNTSSPQQLFTVTNTGTEPLIFNPPAANLFGPQSGDFQIVSNGCLAAQIFNGGVAPGGSCTVGVVFAPIAANGTGLVSATLAFLENSSSSPDNIVVEGVAVAPPINGVVASPADLVFGDEGIGTTSAPLTETVTNTGTTSVPLGVASVNTGEFPIVADSCSGVSLPGGSSCTLQIVFKPTVLGDDTGALSIPVGGFPTITIPLFGTGVPATSVTIAPNPVNFGPQQAGTSSTATIVTVTNNGPAPLVFDGTTAESTLSTPDFAVVGDTCTSNTVAVGFTCQYEVVFTPPAGASAGPVSDHFLVHDNAGGSPQTVTLNGTVSSAQGALIATPAVHDFGPQGLFLTSPEFQIKVTNNGTGPVTISGDAITGPAPGGTGDFAIASGTDQCSGKTLDVGSTCTVEVTFTPSIIGIESAELDFTYAGGASVLTVPLFGTGVPPATDTISPTSLNFGTVAIGDTSAEQYVTLTNTDLNGEHNRLIVFFDFTQGPNGSDFNIVTDTCSGPGRFGDDPGQSCVIGLVFQPGAATSGNETRSGTLIIKDNTNGDAQSVALTGLAPVTSLAYTVTPNPLAFGTQATGTTSGPQTATVTNITPGTVALLFPATAGAVKVTGANANEFQIQDNFCKGASVAPFGDPGDTCTVDVVFAPTVTGPAFASLTFSPTNGVPEAIQLTGSGLTPGSIGFPGLAAGGLEYGNVIVNTTQNVNTPPIPDPQSIVIQNTSGTSVLTVSSLTILGTNAADYAIIPVAGNCTAAPFTVPIFGSCTVTILFTPSALGDRTAFVNIVSNAPFSPQQIPLDGTGVPARPVQGYWLVGSDGGVFAFGAAHYLGGLGNLKLNKPVVGMAPTPDGKGYWLVASDGGIFTFGDAQYYGSTGNLRLNAPIVGMAAAPDGRGYWLVATDGGIFAFGDAVFYGSVPGVLKPGQVLNKPIVAMTKTPDGGGYLLVASDGGIFAFGDSHFWGSAANYHLVSPINGAVVTPAIPTLPNVGADSGYLLSAGDGGVFAFGNANFLGSAASLNLKKPIVGISSTPDYGGYWQAADDGGVFAFGDAQFGGSTGDFVATHPDIVGIATDPVLGFPG
jgi:hypothetical protein